MPYWIIDTGQCYGTEEGCFVDIAPDSAQKLYTRDKEGNPVIGGKEYLRSTLLFYGYPLTSSVIIKLDEIQAIQAEYEPHFNALQSAKAGAEMRDNMDEVAEIKNEYLLVQQEMQEKIKEILHG